MNINENDAEFDRDFLKIRETIAIMIAGKAALGLSDDRARADAVASVTAADPFLRVVQRLTMALERIADAQEIRNRR